MFNKDVSENLVESSMKEVRKCPIPVIRRDFEFCDSFDIMTEIDRISLPTLIIVGADDVMTPPKYARYLQKNIEGAELRIIKKAGHSVMLEQSKIFNQAVLDWIERVSSS
jgi:pimeloyl-ACP methyl ester carboxylesterase